MKSKPITILVFTFIIIVGLVIFLIGPVASLIFSSWRDLASTKENLKIIEQKKQVLDSLKNNPNLSRVGKIAEDFIPKEEDAGQLVIELTAMGQGNNLTIEQISIEKSKETTAQQAATETGKATPTPTSAATPSTAAEAKTVDFTMKINGNFSDFMNFFKATETSSRLIVIKKISMQTKTEGDKNPTFNVELSGSAYYKSEVSVEQNLANIEIPDEVIQGFLNLKTYGQPIDLPGESGFGRSNPFENY